MPPDGADYEGGPGRFVLEAEVEKARARAGSDALLMIDRRQASLVVSSCEEAGRGGCGGAGGSLARAAAKIAEASSRALRQLGSLVRVAVEYKRPKSTLISEVWLLPGDQSVLLYVWRGRKARLASPSKVAEDAKSLDTLFFVYSGYRSRGR